MAHPETSSAVRILSMRTFDSRPSQAAEWHAHRFHELCFAADRPTTIGRAGGECAARPDTLFHFPPGERHRYWNTPQQAPRFWVLHFVVGRSHHRRFPFLRGRGLDGGAWPLTAAQTSAFKTHFLRIFRENTEPRPLQGEAQAAWLHLLLVQIQRWAIDPALTVPVNEQPSPELMRMWQLVSECVGRPDELGRRVQSEVRNYDSLRHAFKRVFGSSPHDVLRKLRLQHAKNLLLETSLSIKEIADQLGYNRQHEFTRTFSRQTGLSPSGWRHNPGLPRLKAG
jgi:hypothetical protein